ncbi:leucine-rich_repeat domain-containing protein [Hexamita inflata]|uniref:Leucine-rich repeat domain-containing protein n=1 Tax=Hexamita inflata TaxID=28002 RepID=A0AA86PN08_9EUKA|nr:leucine-rich repeat domain-containing protein [Hexamita inflata]
MAQLTKLYISGCNIIDLAQIQSLNNLEQLDITFNQVESILPLRKMAKLTLLNFGNNAVLDASPLRKLINIQELDASNNQIICVQALQGLSRLNKLNLSHNRIINIQTLKCKIGVTYLNLGNNYVQDTSLQQNQNNISNLYFGYQRKPTKEQIKFSNSLIGIEKSQAIYQNFNSKGTRFDNSWKQFKNKLCALQDYNQQKHVTFLNISASLFQQLSQTSYQ